MIQARTIIQISLSYSLFMQSTPSYCTYCKKYFINTTRIMSLTLFYVTPKFSENNFCNNPEFKTTKCGSTRTVHTNLTLTCSKYRNASNGFWAIIIFTKRETQCSSQSLFFHALVIQADISQWTSWYWVLHYKISFVVSATTRRKD